ncbi:hypothetical protein GCM10009836_24620 [Pseudonocardia ailaonensis]|uniref:Luciferase-like domain-containing protein n=1 Tax=Pseudonocardia ailaonensis TaxID=367279 RepID=A0ABN2MZ08_9PSEU
MTAQVSDDRDGRVRLALTLPVGGQVFGDDVRQIVEAARRAEDAGVDTVVVVDHVVMGLRTDRYRWGTFRFPEGSPWPEPLTLLSAVAAVTGSVRLSTGILIAGLRSAPLLAKTAATLDRISAGRLELGVGTGWQREEYEASGLDFERRAGILDDTIGAAQALWRAERTDFDSPTVQLSEIRCDPAPVQEGGPAILFSGPLTPRNLRRIRTLGQGWIPIMRESGDNVREGVALLREEFRDAGRDPRELRVRTDLPFRTGPDGSPSLEATLAEAATLAAFGVTEVALHMGAFVGDPAGVDPFLARLAREWKAAAPSVALG